MIEFLSNYSNLIEISILFISAISAFIIYYINHVDKIKSAAIAIKQQIKDTEKHVDILKRYCVDFHAINEQDLYISAPIFNQNQFDKYLEVLIPHLSQDEYEMLHSFYELASTIHRLQSEVKQFSFYALQARANCYYSQSYSLLNGNIAEHGSVNGTNIDMNTSENNRTLIQNKVTKFGQEFNSINVGAYIPVQYKMYFDKYLSEYSKLSGTTLLNKIDTLAKKKSFLFF